LLEEGVSIKHLIRVIRIRFNRIYQRKEVGAIGQIKKISKIINSNCPVYEKVFNSFFASREL